MRKTVRLDCGVAFEEQERLQKPARGGIALNHSRKVRARCLCDRAVGQERLEQCAFETLSRKRRMVEPSGEILCNRMLKASGVKNALV